MSAKKKKPIDYSKRALTFLRSHLRRCWMYYSISRKNALNDAKRPNPTYRDSRSENVRIKYLYRCYSCSTLYPLRGVQVDHIHGLGNLDFHNIQFWFNRLMVGEQAVICKECHRVKTNKDRKNK